MVISDGIPAVPRNRKLSEFRSEPFRGRENSSEFRSEPFSGRENYLEQNAASKTFKIVSEKTTLEVRTKLFCLFCKTNFLQNVVIIKAVRVP
jgi:hypothetical protein